MSNQPPRHAGLRHAALYVQDLEACTTFYTKLMGMEIEWQPDSDNCYLSSGNDNLALHVVDEVPSGPQRLDHIGFIIGEIVEVDLWYEFLLEHEIEIFKPPKTHRDGARSFYCRDPDGNVVQVIYHPPLATVD